MVQATMQIVGIAEIAIRRGVHVQTVKGWRARGLLGEPIGTVSGNPAFDFAEVERRLAADPPTPGRRWH